LKNLGKYFKGDKTIWLIILLLALFSLLVVYSSTAAIISRSSNASPFYFFAKQLMFFGVGFIILYVTHRVPYQLFLAVAKIGFFVSLALLILTFLIGNSYNQASRTLGFFQPSELAKVMLIVYVAKLLTVKQDIITDLKKGYRPILWPILATCFFIFLSNFSTAAILGTTCCIMMFIGRVKIKHLLGTIGVLLLLLVIGVGVAKGVNTYADYKVLKGEKIEGALKSAMKIINKTRFETIYSRLEAKVGNNKKTDSGNEELGQSDYSRLAIASGGLLMGKGPGNSTMRYILPEAFSDFVFAIIVEEWGVLISCFLVLAYLIILFRVGVMVRKSTHFFPALLAIGISVQITMQALVNMCVATGIAPVTGQNLPLISQGGSSIIATCIMFGMLLSVSRSLKTEDAEGEAENKPDELTSPDKPDKTNAVATKNSNTEQETSKQIAINTLANL
jgi:cell division protein FtsW